MAVITTAQPHTSGLRTSRPQAFLWVLAASLVALLVVFADTVRSLVAVWTNSNTFAHGLLVPAIVLFLAWNRRDLLKAVAFAPWPWGIALIVPVLVVWLAGSVLNVELVTGAALFALITLSVIVILGRAAAAVLWFPLVFLWFAWPAGESLVRPLMSFTAEFVVVALRLVGIPVFHEGYLLATASGDFQVAEACSGIRFLFASVAFGALLGELQLRSPARRLALLLASVLVPIVCNGLRASAIVVIAHVSEMRYAVGFDHFVYGWAFFGVVIAVLLWIAHLLRDPPLPHVADAPSVPAPSSEPALRGSIACALAIFALSAATVFARAGALSDVPGAGEAGGGIFGTGAAEVTFSVRDPGEPPSDATESILISADRADIGHLTINRAEVEEGGTRILRWSWYVVDGEPTASATHAKVLQLRALASGRRTHPRLVEISTRSVLGADEANARLLEFLTTERDTIDECSSDPGACP
jgi:exosortase A